MLELAHEVSRSACGFALKAIGVEIMLNVARDLAVVVDNQDVGNGLCHEEGFGVDLRVGRVQWPVRVW